jgi:hypothetical protein
MPLAPFHCALGDSPEVELQAAATVNIAPGDDSVDTNRVRIVGAGTITSLGVPCQGQTGELGEQATVTKRIYWLPTAPGTITLKHNPPFLCLLGEKDRTIAGKAFGTYCSDVTGYWQEDSFSLSSESPTASGGALLAMIYYTASATITIPPGATRAWVRMWGGSGASGGTGAGGVTIGSAGTGAGGYLEKFLTGLTPANTLTFTRGNAGAPVSGNNGGNGSASTLASGTQTIATLTANGSNGSAYVGAADMASYSNTGIGTPGGTATGGDLNVTGQRGGNAYAVSYDAGSGAIGSNASWPGQGGASAFARGAAGVAYNSPLGNPGIPGGLIIAWFNDASL